MRKFFLFIIVVLSYALLSCSNEQRSYDSSGNPPNIILIISDDHSWPDHGFMEHPEISTPNIDKLSSEGLTFTRGYLAAPVCRPSLASIITGRYPHEHGVTGNDPSFEFDGDNYSLEWSMERVEYNEPITERVNNLPNIPKLLDKKNYLSLQTGKWWEGSWEDAGFTHGMTHGDPKWGGRHGDEGLEIGREGISKIKNFMDYAAREDRPFFVWYAPFMPHTPHNPPDSLLQKYLSRSQSESVAKYWAMIEWLDITIGELLSAVDERELSDNTMVLYVVDNGWVQDPDGQGFEWRSKQSPYDMGIRTPAIVKWPGNVAASTDTTTLVSSVDIAPTVLGAAGIDPPQQMAGIDILDRQQLNKRSEVYSEDYNHDIKDVQSPTNSLEHRVIISPPWKLIVPKKTGTPQNIDRSGGGDIIDFIEDPELYHIMNDPYEKNNLADERPEVVERLRQRLDSWWQED